MQLLLTHAKQLGKCSYKNFHFYLLTDSLTENIASCIKENLPNNSTIFNGIFPGGSSNYMSKVRLGLDQDHEFLIKMDEDTVLTSDGWDRLFALTESMQDNDLFCTGAISSGIPTCDLYIKNFLPKYKTILDNMFSLTRYDFIPALLHPPFGYGELHPAPSEEWNSDKFYEKVSALETYYKGIHPVRANFLASKFINDKILEDLPSTMKPIDSEIIRDSSKYPYFCNNIFGIRSKDWRELVDRHDLYVDAYDEVVLNKFKKEKNKNMVIDTGIPIIHTLYNWLIEDPNYEPKLIDEINELFNREEAVV